MTEPRAPRRRRTAEEAREAILAAAERRFVDSGPEGLRLQDVARDVGISHPTVLHHFGSRDDLRNAVIDRVHETIFAEVFAALGDSDLGETSLTHVLDRVAGVLGTKGHARVLYWLALSGLDRRDAKPLSDVADAAHQLRRTRGKPLGGSRISREDTRFLVMLATFALTAESVLGTHLFGQDDEAATSQRFRAWLAKLLAAHLESA